MTCLVVNLLAITFYGLTAIGTEHCQGGTILNRNIAQHSVVQSYSKVCGIVESNVYGNQVKCLLEPLNEMGVIKLNYFFLGLSILPYSPSTYSHT